MVDVANTISDIFTHSSTSLKSKSSSSRTRELKKRKGVHFDKIDYEENTYSTSDFLFQEGKQWRYVATRFNCEEDRSDGDNNVNELLNLCNWYDNRERNPEIDFSDDDSDDEIPFPVIPVSYAPSKPTFPTPTSSISSNSTSRVSSLRLASKLRLESTRNLLAENGSQESVESQESSDDGEDLESAFQGVMTKNCGVQVNKAPPTETVQTTTEKKTEDDFWNDVEF